MLSEEPPNDSSSSSKKPPSAANHSSSYFRQSSSHRLASSKPLSQSEANLDGYTHFLLDHSSRSLSTWVALGENSVTSELPSPQVRER